MKSRFSNGARVNEPFKLWADALNAAAVRRGEVCNQPDHLPNIFWESFPMSAENIAAHFGADFDGGLSPAAALDAHGFVTWDVVVDRYRAEHPWWWFDLQLIRMRMLYRRLRYGAHA
jgi:hypothetical protein